MNIPDETQAAPGYGSLQSPVVIVGQSLCGPCMKKQEPFYGGTGEILDDALASARLTKKKVYTTNVVHCHPRENRPSLPYEIENCTPYLRQELALVRPRLVIGLGENARDVLELIYPEARRLDWPFTTPRGRTPAATSLPALLFPPHPGSFRRKRKDIREQQTQGLGEMAGERVAVGFSRRPSSG
jgi:uracil-DNA glycosylase family 4